MKPFSLADRREQVIRVDEGDRVLGPAWKIQAHQDGALHRAFSVFLFDRRARLLLQRRADVKYHSGGLWANSCCGHPRPGEPVRQAAERRLEEELGIAVSLRAAFQARYRAELDNGLIENELVHMMVGYDDQIPRPDPDEASATRWVSLGTLHTEINAKPDAYTAWLRFYVRHHFDALCALSTPVVV